MITSTFSDYLWSLFLLLSLVFHLVLSVSFVCRRFSACILTVKCVVVCECVCMCVRFHSMHTKVLSSSDHTNLELCVVLSGFSH